MSVTGEPEIVHRPVEAEGVFFRGILVAVVTQEGDRWRWAKVLGIGGREQTCEAALMAAAESLRPSGPSRESVVDECRREGHRWPATGFRESRAGETRWCTRCGASKFYDREGNGLP